MAAIHCSKTLRKCQQTVLAKFLSTRPQLQQNDINMQAWQINSYGDLNEIQLNSSAKIPFISKPHDVLVKVAAASVNPIDVAMLGGYGSTVLGGLREAERLCCPGPSSLEFPMTLGRDFAGEVVSCGLGVKGLQPGDQVWGVVPPHQQGSHAEYVLASSNNVCKKPDHLSNVEAGSLPYAAMTAWSSLYLSAGLYLWPTRGTRVLVLGGSGGVGTAALQILKAWDAQVVTTCRTDAVPLLESLGADAVVDYTQQDANKLIKEQGPYDIILNASGVQGTPHLDCLKEWRLARYVTVTSPLLKNVDEYGLLVGSVKSAFDLIAPNIQGVTKGATIRWGFFVPLQLGLSQITELTKDGKISPVIHKKFTFADLPNAYQNQREGHLRGKLVIDMDAPLEIPRDEKQPTEEQPSNESA